VLERGAERAEAGLGAQVVQPREHRARVQVLDELGEHDVADAAERAAHRLHAQAVGRDALAGEREQRRQHVRPRPPARLGGDGRAIGERVDEDHVGVLLRDRALEVGALERAAAEHVVQALAELVGVLALGVVVDLDGGDAGVGGRGVEAGRACGGEQPLAGADVDVVAAALQLLQAGDEREEVPGGGHDVGEDASH
jgi:hypothetical protein